MSQARSDLFSKLLQVVAAVEGVPKLGWNAHFKYHFVRENDMVAAIRQQLIEKGIMFVPSVSGVPTQTGSITTVNLTMMFVDIESGETYTAFWAGAGQDSSEKGLYKAYTGAIKTFFQKCFLVPTESTDPEDDEPRSAEKTTAPAPEKPAAPAKGGKPGQRQFFATLDRAIKDGTPGYGADLYQSSEARQALRDRLLGEHVEAKDMTNDHWVSCALQVAVEMKQHLDRVVDESWEPGGAYPEG